MNSDQALLPPLFLSGTKYRYARQWKMYCVTPQWFNDSMECGYCMPEVEYDVDGSGSAEKEPEKAENYWKKNLESFKLPTVADDEFLDGCKVSSPHTVRVQVINLRRNNYIVIHGTCTYVLAKLH